MEPRSNRIPAVVGSATYGTTDQVLSWNGVSSTVDDASNLTYDPASGLTLTWTARNQMATATGALEAYDGLGRREQSTESFYLPTYELYFLHDGGSVLGWLDDLGNFWDFLNLPGGGALAGSNTVSGTTTTWVPLIDASGSTIALVNAASTQSAPATSFTYDPFGSMSSNGASTNWPFLFEGGEHEFTDPGSLYYDGSGNYYNPQIMRSLSETSQTSSQGTGGGPSGGSIAAPSGGGNGSFGHWLAGQLNPFGQPDLGGLPDVTVTVDEVSSYFIPVGAIAEAIEELVSFFEWLFGGSSPTIPRQLLHARHPLYPVILGVQDGLIPTEGSEAPPSEISSSPCNPPPLQELIDDTAGGPGDEDWCINKCSELALEKGIGRKEAPDQGMNFFRCVNQCMGTGDYPEWRPYFPSGRNSSSSSFSVPKVPWWYVIPFLPFPGNPLYEGL